MLNQKYVMITHSPMNVSARLISLPRSSTHWGTTTYLISLMVDNQKP